MKVGIMQPYFLPYIGYFQLIKHVEKFVFADDMNFIKGGWINRNNILLGGKPIMIHLQLLGASQNLWIRSIEIAPNSYQLLKTIEVNYRKAPFFKDVFPLIEEIIQYQGRNLARYVGNSLIKISEYLKFDTQFEYEGDNIQSEHVLKSQERLISNCKTFGATKYINAIGGKVLYCKEEFKKNGIELSFLQPRPIEYKQFNHEFVPNLSIVDVLMFNSIEKTNELLMQFDLV
jgi:hypothetical protein